MDWSEQTRCLLGFRRTLREDLWVHKVRGGRGTREGKDPFKGFRNSNVKDVGGVLV